MNRLVRTGIALGLIAGVVPGVLFGVRFVLANGYLRNGHPNTALFYLQRCSGESVVSIALPVILFFLALSLFTFLIRRVGRGDTDLLSWRAASTFFFIVLFAFVFTRLRGAEWYPSIHSAGGVIASGSIALVLSALAILAWRKAGDIRRCAARLLRWPPVERTLRLRYALLLLLVPVVLTGSHRIARSLAAEDGPSFLFLTVDTLRADRLSVYGNPRNTSPHIDRLAREGTLFEQGIVQWPKTSPSFASIMTSTYGRRNGVVRFVRLAVPERLVLLGEMLMNRFFRTAAVVTNPNLSTLYRFDQGFEWYTEMWMNYEMKLDRRQDAEFVADRGIEWLGEHGGDGRFFLWLHFTDPHTLYRPPPPFRELYVGDRWYREERRAPLNEGRHDDMHGIPAISHLDDRTQVDYYIAEYDAEIRYMDSQIGRLLGALVDLGLDEKTLIVLTSDHGEGFGEHDYYFEHGRLPYDGCSRVPLIVRLPGRAASPPFIGEPAALIHIVPTALEILGVSPGDENEIEGTSLAGVLEGRTGELPDHVFTESGYADEYCRAVRTRRWKLAYVPDEITRGEMRGVPFELYDLANDPGERENLFDSEPVIAESLKTVLLDWIAGGGPTPALPDTGVVEVDRATRDALRALGYVD